MSKWTGVPKVRAAFRGEGFGLPDTYARLAADLCDGAFTVEEFLEDDDRNFLKVLSGERHVTPCESGTPRGIFLDRCRQLDLEIVHTRFARPLVLARFEELERARESVEPPLRKATEIRAYAEKFGQQNGFVLKRNKEEFYPFNRSFVKKMPRTEIVGGFAVDAGGKSSMTLTHEGKPVFYGGVVGLCFSLSVGSPGQNLGRFRGSDFISGVGQYDLVECTRGRRSAYDYSGRGDLDFVSKTASWGARAQLRFFYNLLLQLDADLPKQGEGVL